MPTTIERKPLSRSETVELIQKFDPHYAAVLQRYVASLDNVIRLPEGLSRLCALGAAIALRAPGMVREFMLGARDAGAPIEQIAEVAFLSTNFAGFEAMSGAMQIFDELFGDAPFSGCVPEQFPVGAEIEGFDGPSLEEGIVMYGPVRARTNVMNFRSAGGPEFARALELYAYAGVFRRRVLPVMEREIICVALLASIERPGPFVWHLKAALRLGAKPEQLRGAILAQSAVSGVVTAFRAIGMANPIIDDWRAHTESDAGF
jgi:alkylhydroperoxidase/carboxymuconolactone decarboxylase family protein YurZ